MSSIADTMACCSAAVHSIDSCWKWLYRCASAFLENEDRFINEVRRTAAGCASTDVAVAIRASEL
jgi:hypothetical protein